MSVGLWASLIDPTLVVRLFHSEEETTAPSQEQQFRHDEIMNISKSCATIPRTIQFEFHPADYLLLPVIRVLFRPP